MRIENKERISGFDRKIKNIRQTIPILFGMVLDTEITMDTEKNLNVDSVDSFKKQYEMLTTIIDSIESQIWASDRENMILLNSSAQRGLA